MKAAAVPHATYRLQFNADFTFADAGSIASYLGLLGITHVYASPFLKARSGSPHGYDIVDHNALNPEIGDRAAFSDYVAKLHEHGMGQILDIVPNHMGVGGDDNAWWLDVLENGESSLYASYFDIDWHPANSALQNRVLLPFLGDHYGSVLEQGDLTLSLDPGEGAFSVRYYEHLFPIDPRTYPMILGFHIEDLEQHLSGDRDAFNAFVELITDCKALPRRTELSSARKQKRHRAVAMCKHRLGEFCRNFDEIRARLQENVKLFNGTAGQPGSFDPLHRLLEAQAYRLSYWLVASDEIDYRRFFDINELAGIRMDNSDVFAATHHLTRELIRNGDVNGLRIDHPDGLSDPLGYYCNLQKMIGEELKDAPHGSGTPYYLVVEKILAQDEQLPGNWPIAGTTGYEVAFLLNRLFVCPDSERSLTRTYQEFTGEAQGFDTLLYESRKRIIHSVLASELTVLANLASSIAQANRHTRDFTFSSLRKALSEVSACFPVYRTYITPGRISAEDRHYIQRAIAQAKKHSQAADIQVFDFIQDLLVSNNAHHRHSKAGRRIADFVSRFQQYTAPVMAKGMEDTAFYNYNRLVSLNDVGFDPRAFGISIDAFHLENRQRLARWPQSMVTTSTHDSKRSEDVRARINVLSEIPVEWRHRVTHWSELNCQKKPLVDGAPAPSCNDEYLLYQTLFGTWPLGSVDDADKDVFRKRINAYMIKAVREAKTSTSWINPNDDYEDAVGHFVDALLDTSQDNAFLEDFVQFNACMAPYGLLGSLSQTLIKLTVPGVPDIYQGNELWSFNLVDPDNRGPVDYSYRQSMLQTLVTTWRNSSNQATLLGDMLNRLQDGHAKLYLTWRTLTLRNQQPEIFSEGAYVGLGVHGPRAAHICAFARSRDKRQIIVCAPRWFARLARQDNHTPPPATSWQDNWIEAPNPAHGNYHNFLTAEPVRTHRRDDGFWFSAAELYRHFPVALLTRDLPGQ